MENNNEKDLNIEHPATEFFNENKEKKPSKAKKVVKFFIYVAVLFFVGKFVFGNWLIVSEQNASQKSLPWYKKISFLSTITGFVTGSDKQLKGEDKDRINILLLGMGGKNHDGGYLTDTIMLVSLKPSTKKVAMVSIPRDLTVPIENMGWRKINNVNAFAEKENPGSGGMAISQTVSDILNIPIDYYFRIDFQGFINIVDQLGGVDVEVENTLDDYTYPVLGNEDGPWESRYEHLHVEKGQQHMDGSLALKFARSRHAYGVEGSDFARAKRQQKIIQGAKDKMTSASFFLRPDKINNVLNELSEHLSTNLQTWEMIKLYSLFKDVNKDSITNKVLDNGPEGFLVNSISSEGAYILSPRSGDFTEIQYMVNTIFDQAQPVDTEKAKKENSKIEIYNGTWINGLASKFSTDLEKEGFKVLRYGNSSHKNFQKSVIYDLTYGNKNESLGVLKTKTNANVSFELPTWLKEDIEKLNKESNTTTNPDFVLILGHSADNYASGAENNNQ